ncbi:hypothetical protein dqs_2217 [Azoarcus olearius]|uniref:type II secretion system protein n=1 Tax=Azoarcus sp. (strain BH72) TaxID=418699 RepID=UPI0008064425|nr:prepilin-type N-terminal cleavage/methylation domain-containing protein [Azoarcus olearius]ANQ85251.1 hypothetical protein dqs_2217 [Azoarcus olearius]
MTASRVRRGFTLIELLVVMAIVALLLAIAAPRYFDHVERARETSLRQSLVVMRDALDKYKADTGRFPHALADLVERRYLRAIPRDPITDSEASWIEVAETPGAHGEGGGVRDVRSGAEGGGLDGTPYADW